MTLSRSPLLLLVIYGTLFTLPSFTSSTPPITNPPPFIVLQDQNLQIPILSIASAPNITFSLSGAPFNVKPSNPPQLSSIHLLGIPTSSIASFINSSYIAFLDDNLKLYYGSYQEDSQTITLNTTEITSQSSYQCSSIASLREYIAISCEMTQGSDNIQVQTLFLFNTSSQTITNITQNVTFSSLNQPLASQVTAAETEFGPLVVIYYDNTTLAGRDPAIILYNIQTSQSNLSTFSNPKNLSIQSVSATYNGLFIADTTGKIFSSSYGGNLTLGIIIQIANVNDNILGSCVYSQDYAYPPFAVFSKSALYYIVNSELLFTFLVPDNTMPTLCSLDTEFAYITVKETINTTDSFYPLVYILGQDNNGYPLVQLNQNLSTTEAIAAGGTPGQKAILAPGSIWILDFSVPVIQVSNVQANATFNLTIEGVEAPIPITVTMISNSSQIYQKASSAQVLPVFGDAVIDLQDLFVGPGLGVETGGALFNGVYGNCTMQALIPSLIGGYQFFSMQLSPSAQPSENTIIASMIYSQGTTLYFTNVIIKNLYSAGSWDSPKNCTATVQGGSSVSHSMSLPPTNCFPGRDYVLCYGDGLFVHITIQNPGVIFQYHGECEQGYLWQTSSYGEDVSICVTGPDVYIWNKTGPTQAVISNTTVGVQYFSGGVSTNPKFPNLVVLTHPDGIIGLEIPLPSVIERLPPTIAFSINAIFSGSHYLQVTSNRIVLIDFEMNSISEWDITDLSNPYYVGLYDLYSFVIQPLDPTYQPIPNHLTVYALNDSTPYLLTFQPGNPATSVLLYATKLSSPLTDALSSAYDLVNQYTIFMLNNLTYVYASNSTYIDVSSSVQPTSGCLYCTGKTTIQAASSVTPSNLEVSLPYSYIASEQSPTTGTTASWTVKSGKPASGSVPSFFDGTPLDYTVNNLTLDQTNVLYLTTPLNLSQTLQQSAASLDPEFNLFSDGSTLYILSANGLSYISNIGATSNTIQNAALNVPNDAIFIDGATAVKGSTALLYTDGDSWNVYLYPSGAIMTFDLPLISVNVIDNLIFVLTGQQSSIVYVLQSNGTALETVMSVPSSVFGLVPLNFVVANLGGNSYAILIVDASDNLYNFIIDTGALTSQQSVIYGFTSQVSADQPPNTLEIIAVQLSAQVSSKPLTVNYLLSVSNFHSYSVEIVYTTTTAQMTSILDCFVQLPGHITTGQSLLTDYYFLDIKELEGVYYIYNYPLNSTYPAGNGQTSYSYMKPVNRQAITGGTYVQLYATLGASSLAFVGSNQGGSSLNAISSERMLSEQVTQASQNIQIQVYKVLAYLEVGFNPSLGSTSLSDINTPQVVLTGSNDNGSVGVTISLDTPINILNSAYFIAFTCVFTILFCGACIWFFRRAYKKRKLKLEQNKESYQATGPMGEVQEISAHSA